MKKTTKSMQQVLCETIEAAEAKLRKTFDQDPQEFAAWTTGLMFSPHNRSLANDPVDKEVGALISLKRAVIFPLGNGMSYNDKRIVKECAEILIKSIREKNTDFKNAYIKERFDNAVRDFNQLPV